MAQRGLLGIVVATFLCCLTASAGLRLPGKYCGVVIFDRWDGCTLSSGVYVMHIADRVKAQLRDRVGDCVQIDAKKVWQYSNPGDGEIQEFEYLGPAPPPAGWSLAMLKLRVVANFDDGESPSFRIIARNAGDADFTIAASEFASTVLMKPPGGRRSSFVLITRQSFWSIDQPRAAGSGVTNGQEYAWKINAPLPESMVLKPNEEQSVTIRLDLPPGEYQILAGYGGGTHEKQCLASNLVSFDIDSQGRAVMPPPPK